MYYSIATTAYLINRRRNWKVWIAIWKINTKWNKALSSKGLTETSQKVCWSGIQRKVKHYFPIRINITKDACQNVWGEGETHLNTLGQDILHEGWISKAESGHNWRRGWLLIMGHHTNVKTHHHCTFNTMHFVHPSLIPLNNNPDGKNGFAVSWTLYEWWWSVEQGIKLSVTQFQSNGYRCEREFSWE